MKYPIPSRVPLPTPRPDQPAWAGPQAFPPRPMAPQMPMQGGNRFMDFLRNNSEALGAMSAGLLSGRTGPEQFGMGMQGFSQVRGAAKEKAEAKKKQSQTLEYLKRMGADPELLGLMESGAISGKEAFDYHLKAQTPKNDLPSSYQEWLLAQQGGYEGSFADWKKSSSGGTTVNVGDGAPGLGKLSTDYGYKLGPDGKPQIGPDGLPIAAPIPGSPAAAEIAAASTKSNSRQSAAATSTRVITSAAQRAREAAQNRQFGGFGQGVIGAINPYSDSAEVKRQVEVLRSTAAAENLQAMRAASPTGGALGNASDADIKLLQDKAGALDPSSPNFERDLNDYELTLLQVVHGYDAGLQIYNSTRAGSVPMGGERDAGIGALIDKYDPQR
jgi:hypothetical protein